MANNNNQPRVKVDDSIERQQLERVKMASSEMRPKKVAPQKKPTSKKNSSQYRKYKLFRFSNIVTWLAIIAVGVAAWYGYSNFIFLGGPYWAKEGGYLRLTDRPEISADIMTKTNDAFKDNEGKSATITQRGPVLNITVSVPNGTSQQDAKNYAMQVVDKLLENLGDQKTAENPYGATFSKYEADILISQKDQAALDEAAQNEIANRGGAANKLPYPIFGTIRKGVVTWSNN